MVRIDVKGSGKSILAFKEYLRKINYPAMGAEVSEVAYHNPTVVTAGTFVIAGNYYPANRLEVAEFRRMQVKASGSTFFYQKEGGKLRGCFSKRVGKGLHEMHCLSIPGANEKNFQ